MERQGSRKMKMADQGRSVSIDYRLLGRHSTSDPAVGNMKLSIMGRSFSTSALEDLDTESTWFYHQPSGEDRICIELEGDGPLGLSFVENDAMEIVVHHIQRGTACSEFPELETKLRLRAINGSTDAVTNGYRSAVDAIAASWRASSEVALVLARPKESAAEENSPPLSAVQTTAGSPSLSGMVGLRDSSTLRSIDCMSPICEAYANGGSSGHLKLAVVPPTLNLAGDLDSPETPLPVDGAKAGGGGGGAKAAAVETKRERNLKQVEHFLRDLKVEGYMGAFVDFGVSSMEDLKFIEPTDLPGFGLKPLQQRRVMAALTKLQATGGQ